MLHLPDTDLRQTKFYREAFAEGEARGEARGEAKGKGKARGEAQGRTQGELLVVLRQLRRCLGTLSQDREAAVRALGRERIETLAEDLLDFRNEADLENWLRRGA